MGGNRMLEQFPYNELENGFSIYPLWIIMKANYQVVSTD